MRLSSLRFSRLSVQLPRRLRASLSSTQDTDVFANSLRKTLEAHRSSNRARLIRKVYPRTPKAPIVRPEVPPDTRASYQRPASPAPRSAEIETKIASKRQTRRRDRKPRQHPSNEQNSSCAIRSINASRDGTHREQRPWLKHLELSSVNGDASTYLHAELQALERYVAPTSSEEAQVLLLNDQVASLLSKVAPQRPQLIGSRRIGLASAHSSVDLLLAVEDISRSPHRDRWPSSTRPQMRSVHLDLLHQVKLILQSNADFNSELELSKRPHSVLKARHGPTGLLLQFSCGERIPALVDFMQDYLSEYPNLRPLYLGTQTLLETRGLFGPPQANIGGDALALLLVAFLKMTHGRFSGPGRLGDQFLAFLELYGFEVDLQSVGVAVDPPEFFSSQSLRATAGNGVESAHRRGQRSLISAKRTAALKGNLAVARRLCVQDPTHYMNDLGKSCTRTAELQNAFAVAAQQLRHAVQTWEGPTKNSSILTTVLQANFDGLESLRDRIVSPVKVGSASEWSKLE